MDKRYRTKKKKNVQVPPYRREDGLHVNPVLEKKSYR